MSIIFNSLFRAFYNIYSTELSSSSSSSGFMTPFTNARYFLHPPQPQNQTKSWRHQDNTRKSLSLPSCYFKLYTVDEDYEMNN